MAAMPEKRGGGWHNYVAVRLKENLAIERIMLVDKFGMTETSSDFSERVAWFVEKLSEHGTPPRLVAVTGRKSRDLVACLAAVIILGAAFCVLDPDSPPNRSSMLHRKLQADWNVTILNDSEVLIRHTDRNPRWLPQGLMYVVFTSGSTAAPKGVMISYENYSHFLDWLLAIWKCGEGHRFSMVNPAHFDNFIADLTLALFSRATGCLLPEPLVISEELRGQLLSSGLTHWFSVPSTIRYLKSARLFNNNALPDLLRCSFGGEPYLLSEINSLRAGFDSSCKFVNVYGPSETTCIASAHEITEEQFLETELYPPIGKLNENFEFRLIHADKHDRELYLVGSQVGLGYLGADQGGFERPSDLQVELPGYSSGDLMRLDDKGLLRFGGRLDRQFKHLGFRVDPAEIENSALQKGKVDEAFACKLDALGTSSIALAYSGNKDPASLEEVMTENLPRHLVPRVFLRLEVLPKNANGKLDMKALVGLLQGELIG